MHLKFVILWFWYKGVKTDITGFIFMSIRCKIQVIYTCTPLTFMLDGSKTQTNMRTGSFVLVLTVSYTNIFVPNELKCKCYIFIECTLFYLHGLFFLCISKVIYTEKYLKWYSYCIRAVFFFSENYIFR